MDNQYRLILAIDSPKTSQVLEWRFSQRDLKFIHHQYNQGVIQKQHQKSLPLIIGDLFIHECADFECSDLTGLFASGINGTTLNNLFHNSDGARLLDTKKARDKCWHTRISIDEGDLFFRIDLDTESGEESSVSVPFSAIEDAYNMMECNHPAVDNKWVIIKSLSMLLTPDMGTTEPYRVEIQKTIELKGYVEVSARSKQEAMHKAANYNGSILFHDAHEHIVVKENIQTLDINND